MIVTIGSTKGGVGKSTFAIQLALARILAGWSVLLVDGDPQGSAQDAIAARAEAGRTPGVSCVHFPDERVLRAQVQQQAPAYDDVIIDVGGRDNATLRMALMLSDLLVVPVQPRSLDVWTIRNITALIDGAQDARVERGRPPLRSMAVLNMADSDGGSDNADAIAAIGEFPQLAMLKAMVRRRKAYANACGLGLGVFEMSPRDPKACNEVAALVRTVFSGADALHSNVKEAV